MTFITFERKHNVITRPILKRHSQNILFGLLVILFFSCNEENRNAKLLYDIEIDYLSTPLEDKRDLPSDSVVICFAGNFNQDTMTIYVNNEFYNRSILTTDDVIGMAGDLKLPDNKQIKKYRTQNK